MPRNRRGQAYDSSERGNNRAPATNHYHSKYGQNNERESGYRRFDKDKDDFNRTDYGRVTYGHGHNYRTNSADRDDDLYERYERRRFDMSGSGMSGTGNRRGYSGGFYGDRRGRDPDYRSDYDRDDDRGFFEKAGDEVRSWFGDDEAQHRRIRDGHTGRGPKNYARSDSRIIEDVNDRLTDNYYVDASDITVSVSDGEVTLDGTVDSRIAKREAEDCADSVSGVRHVQNNLRVTEHLP